MIKYHKWNHEKKIKIDVTNHPDNDPAFLARVLFLLSDLVAMPIVSDNSAMV